MSENVEDSGDASESETGEGASLSRSSGGAMTGQSSSEDVTGGDGKSESSIGRVHGDSEGGNSPQQRSDKPDDDISSAGGGGGGDSTTPTTDTTEPTTDDEVDGASGTTDGQGTSSSLRSDAVDSRIPMSFSRHANAVRQRATSRDYRPPTPSSSLPWIHARSTPITQGLEQPGVRVRPELHTAIEQAMQDATQHFPNDEFHRVDYFEAALTVALWHHPEVLALMAEFGYGMKD